MHTPSKCHILALMTVFSGSAVLAGCAIAPADDEEVDSAEEALSTCRCPEDVPPELTPDADQRLAFVWHAVGVQIYTCRETVSGHAWTFVAPKADLLNENGKVVGTHFAGPTWRANDGSTVVAAVVGIATPDPDAIPWLLLEAVSHSGQGRMTNVTSIQRMNTVGGKAPSCPCGEGNEGAVKNVPYQADYFFYRTGNPSGNPQCRP